MKQTMTFPQALDWIKMHLDIVEVVSRRVPLKRAGRNLQGLCPFHAEKTPSFNVSSEKQLFKCFGCGEGGDSLTFLMKLDNKSFSDVIEDLAEDYGIDIIRDGQSGPNPEQKAEKERLYELHQKAADLYREHLVNTPMPQDYLAGRGFSPTLQAQFGLGYAPPGWRHVQEALIQKHPSLNVTAEALVKLGLLIQKEDSQNPQQAHYDRFRNRLMVPIADEKGRVVAFGARALDPADEPKYLNSPETDLYIKHRILYGLHVAKTAIRATETAIVMEGYFDVMSAHAVGWTQAVGVCGTALSPEHLKLLQRAGAKTIYLCFDTDKAGQNATLKTLEALQVKALESGLALKVIALPIGKDPDEYFRSDTSEAITSTLPYILDDALDGWAYQFDAALATVSDPHTMDGRIQSASRIVPILQRIHKPVLQHEWVRLLAKRIGVTEESLHLELKQHANVTKSQSAPSKYAQNQKTFSNEAIPSLDPRYKKRSAANGYLNSKGSRGAAGSSKQQQMMAIRVREDVRELRSHLAPKKADSHKEAELLSFIFLSESTWDYMMSACESLEFSTPEAQWFMSLLQGLTRELNQLQQVELSLDHRILRVREAIHTDDSVAPESRHRMLKFLADRVFEAEKLSHIYLPAPSTAATAAVGSSLEKCWRVIDTIIASLKLSKEKQRLGDMLEALRSSEIAGDEASTRLGQELKTLTHHMRVSLGQQTAPASDVSGPAHSPQTVDTASSPF